MKARITKARMLFLIVAILAISLACGGGGVRTERCLAMPGSSTAGCPSGSVPLASCAPTGWGDTQFVQCQVGR